MDFRNQDKRRHASTSSKIHYNIRRCEFDHLWFHSGGVNYDSSCRHRESCMGLELSKKEKKIANTPETRFLGPYTLPRTRLDDCGKIMRQEVEAVGLPFWISPFHASTRYYHISNFQCKTEEFE